MTDKEFSGGVWAIVDRDYYEKITMVFQSEIDALREINGRNIGRVIFLPFGKSLDELT